MSKGGGGSTRSITTTAGATQAAQPYIEYGMSEAQKLYESGTPQYFPQSTVVGFSPETEMALGGLRQQAIAGSPFVPAVQDVVMQNLMGTNPLQSAAMRPVMEQMQGRVSQAGRYGSGYGDAAIAQALAPLAYQAQQQALAQAPAAREFGMADLGTLAQVGAAREALSQAELAADVERFQFEQARPAQKLADYMTLIQGGSGALGTQQITPQFRSPATGFLSGGISGAQTASAIGVDPMYGAIGGALLGGLG